MGHAQRTVRVTELINIQKSLSPKQKIYIGANERRRDRETDSKTKTATETNR